jgi:hypothetical protein
MTDRATLEAILDAHALARTIDIGAHCVVCIAPFPCPARTAAEIGLALVDQLRDCIVESKAMDDTAIRLGEREAAVRADAERLAASLRLLQSAGLTSPGDDRALAAHDAP